MVMDGEKMQLILLEKELFDRCIVDLGSIATYLKLRNENKSASAIRDIIMYLCDDSQIEESS
jgi:hypothetical protein